MSYIELLSAAAAGLYLYHNKRLQQRALGISECSAKQHPSPPLHRRHDAQTQLPCNVVPSTSRGPSQILSRLPCDALASIFDFLDMEDVAHVSVVNVDLWRRGPVVPNLWGAYCAAAHSNLERMAQLTTVQPVKLAPPSLPHFQLVGGRYIGHKRQLEEIERSQRQFHLRMREQKKLAAVQTFFIDVRDALIRFSLAWFSTLLVSCVIAHNVLVPSCADDKGDVVEGDSDPVAIVLDLIMINALLFLYFWSTQRADLFLGDHDGTIDVDIKPAGLFGLILLMSFGTAVCAFFGWRKPCTEPWAQKHEAAFLLSSSLNCFALVAMQMSAATECGREWIVKQYEHRVTSVQHFS